MTRAPYFLSAVIGLLFALPCGISLAHAGDARGLDFRTYLSIQRGMTEGAVFAVAGQPDLVAEQGFAPDTTTTAYASRYPAAAERPALLVKTFTYLPTPEEPYITTVTFVGGRVKEIERVKKSRAVPAQAHGPRGLDFLAYLSLQQGMTEGEVLSVAGSPDLIADQGFAPQTTTIVYSTGNPLPVERLALAVRTYSYLATTAEPYTTTITFVGGRVQEIERNRKF